MFWVFDCGLGVDVGLVWLVYWIDLLFGLDCVCFVLVIR